MAFDPDTSLERAMETFWAKGFETTSMQDLLDAMKLSKSSLYQQYGDKRSLFTRCLDHYCDAQTQAMVENLARAPSGMAFIESTFREVIRAPKQGPRGWGCLLMNSASEFGVREGWISPSLKRGKRLFFRVFHAAVLRAQEEGDIAADRNPDELAHYLVSNMSGLRNLLKTGASKSEADGIVDTMLTALR